MNLDQLQEYCMSFPGAEEEVKWDSLLCFMVGRKIFCTASLDEGNLIGFKVPKEEFEEMLSRDGIVPAPYFHRAWWVRVAVPGALKPAEYREHIRRSYELVKASLPKKVRDSIV